MAKGGERIVVHEHSQLRPCPTTRDPKPHCTLYEYKLVTKHWSGDRA